MATATARTPAQLLSAYRTIQGLTGVHPDILEELTKSFDYTDGFTDAAKCEEIADNMNDLLDLAGYDESTPAAPAPVVPAPAPKPAARKPATPAAKPAAKGKAKGKGKGKNVEKEKKENKVDNVNKSKKAESAPQSKGSDEALFEQLATEQFKPGDRVQVRPAAELAALPASVFNKLEDEEMPGKIESWAGKAGTVVFVKNDPIWFGPLTGGGHQKRQMASVKFDDGTHYNDQIPQVALVATKKAAAKPVPQLLEGMDDEACRLLVKENDKRARDARREADLQDFRSTQAKAGKSEAEVAALTLADLDAHKKKRTLSQVANEGSERLVHSIVKHISTKSAPLKALPERLSKLRDDLEAQAAEHVAEFARKEAQWVADAMLKAMSEADEDHPEVK